MCGERGVVASVYITSREAKGELLIDQWKKFTALEMGRKNANCGASGHARHRL